MQTYILVFHQKKLNLISKHDLNPKRLDDPYNTSFDYVLSILKKFYDYKRGKPTSL